MHGTCPTHCILCLSDAGLLNVCCFPSWSRDWMEALDTVEPERLMLTQRPKVPPYSPVPRGCISSLVCLGQVESGTKDGVEIVQDQVLGKRELNIWHISERQRCTFSASSVSSEPRGQLCFIKPVTERNDSWSAMLKLHISSQSLPNQIPSFKK